MSTWRKKLNLFFKKGILKISGFESLNEGDPNFEYKQVKYLCCLDSEIVTYIHSKSQNYVIVDTLEGGYLVVYANDAEMPKLNTVMVDFNEIKAFLTKREMIRFKSRIASGLRMALEGRSDAARTTFNNIKAKVTQLRSNHFRISYLLGAFSLFCLLLLAVVGLQILEKIGVDTDFSLWNETKLLHVLLFSSIGGFFSVTLSYKTIVTNIPEAGQRVYFLNGILRICIAVMAGIVAYQLMMSGMLMNFFKDNTYGLYTLCILAGFTESFIPKILDKTANEALDDKTQA
jgi:hypothetical protein